MRGGTEAGRRDVSGERSGHGAAEGGDSGGGPRGVRSAGETVPHPHARPNAGVSEAGSWHG